MGLQKGQSGYVFRWLIPIFSLVASLAILGDAVVATFASSVFKDFDILDLFALVFPQLSENISTFLKLHEAWMWLVGLMMFTLAILAFVMNKKGAYIFAVVGGGIGAVTFLFKTLFYLWFYSQINANDFFDFGYAKPFLLAGLFMLFVFAFSVCICIFGAVSLPKCEYEKTIGERNAVGENLTYVGFENDNASYMSNYHIPNPAGPPDPYDSAIKPFSNDKKGDQEREIYIPSGPTGSILGTKGMYREAKFTISDQEELVIGRDPRVAQIVIGEGAQNVSREHCRISYSAGDNSYGIKDMSKNGTFSSASKLKFPHGVYTKVPAGTEIYLGDRSNMFRLG